MGKEKPKETPGRKVQLSFTLMKGVNDKFLEHCKGRMLNKSQVLESIIKSYLDSVEFAGMERKI